MARATTNTRLIFGVLIILFSASTEGIWPFDGTTTEQKAMVHPTVSCPLGPCTWIPNSTFSCPQRGCNEINLELGDDLEQLLLQSNNITVIPKLQYKNLKLLNLGDNNIHKIEGSAFQECNDLETLLLPNNKLSEETTTANSLFGLSKLKYLYLQANEFTRLPNLFHVNVPELERLDFSKNRITTIEWSSFNSLHSLKFLHLQNNEISVLTDKHFWVLKNLEYLELMENRLTTLSNGLFSDLGKLVHLNVNWNNISEIQKDAFSGLNNLKVLSIEHNKLQILRPGDFAHLTSLNELSIGYNYFQALEPGTLPPTINKLSLVFSHGLRTLENGSLAGMPALNEVYISSCHNLQHIDVGAFEGDTSIEIVDLSNNHLQTLHREVLPWRQLVYLDLSGNPWDCDCHLEWMLEVTMHKVARDMIKCDTPLSLRDRFLSTLSYDEFRCKPRQFSVSFRSALATALVLLFTFIFCSALALFLYKCRHRVCPCLYSSVVGKYKAMYSSVEDDEEAVRIEKKAPPPAAASMEPKVPGTEV